MTRFLAAIGLAASASANLILTEGGERQCVDPNRCNGNEDLFPFKVQPNFSTLWDVEYKKTYKIITIKGTPDEPEKHIIGYQCGTTPPAISELPSNIQSDVTSDSFLELPVRTAYVASSTYVGFYELIGEIGTIKVSNAAGVANPCYQKQTENSQTTELPFSNDNFKVFPTNVDVAFASAGPYGLKTENATVVIPVKENKETTNLAKAEWVEFFALFYNKEQTVAGVIDTIEEEYLCAKNVEKPVEPKVAWMGEFDGNKCPNYYCELLKDAGVTDEIFFNSGDYTANETLREELNRKALEAAVDADYFFFQGFKSYGAWDNFFKKHNDTIRTMKAYKNGNIYSHMERNWFESRLPTPNEVLLDLIAIMQPTLTSGRSSIEDNKFFYETLTEKGYKEMPTSASCVDPSQPVYVTRGCNRRVQDDFIPKGFKKPLESEGASFCEKINNNNGVYDNVASLTRATAVLTTMSLGFTVFFL